MLAAEQPLQDLAFSERCQDGEITRAIQEPDEAHDGLEKLDASGADPA